MAPASAAPPTARLMQRCGGGYRELPSSLFAELEQSHRTIDELRHQLEREQALTAERSLVQQRSEKEGSAAHALVQALAQTELAVETAVTVRDKVVEAYQEILRMPV